MEQNCKPSEGDDPLAEADDGELEEDGAVGGVEEEDLVELLPLLLPPPQVEHAQLRPLPRRRRREPHPPLPPSHATCVAGVPGREEGRDPASGAAGERGGEGRGGARAGGGGDGEWWWWLRPATGRRGAEEEEEEEVDWWVRSVT